MEKLTQQLHADLKKAMCHKCKKKGHIAKSWLSRQAGVVPWRQNDTRPVHQLEQEDNSEVYTMYNLQGAKVDPSELL